MRIVIVEDDERLAENIDRLLSKHNHAGSVFYNGQDALFAIESEEYDIAIIDWMLPDMSGIDLCGLVRKRGMQIPILMLTAKSQDDDVVTGLQNGADDYLTKPYSSDVLMARLTSLYRRRGKPVQSPLLRVGPICLNQNTCRVTINRNVINLAPKEYALLECLMLNKGKVLDRMYLLEHVWGEHVDDFSNTVDVHIRYLRMKLKHHSRQVKTVKGKGYMICE